MLYQAVRTEVNKTLSCGLMLTWIKTGLCLILLLSINIKGFQFLCVCVLSIIISLVLSYLLTFSSVQFSSVAQSCLTLCDPMNHSTPGLPVHHQLLTLGLLKYPTLNRICVLQNFQLYCAKSLQSRLTLCDPIVAHQAPVLMELFRQEYWSGLTCSPPGELPNPGIKPKPLMSPLLAAVFFTTSATWEALSVSHSL